MFVWCMITVMMDCGLGKNVLCAADTSVKGKVLRINEDYYLVDFSDYAKKQGYEDLVNPKMVEKNICMEDKQMLAYNPGCRRVIGSPLDLESSAARPCTFEPCLPDHF